MFDHRSRVFFRETLPFHVVSLQVAREYESGGGSDLTEQYSQATLNREQEERETENETEIEIASVRKTAGVQEQE